MNLRVSLLALVIFCTLSPDALSAPKKRAASKAAAEDPWALKETEPARQLAPYIEHLDQLLALRRGPVFDEATGKLAVLRKSFADRRKDAQGQDKAALDAAIVTCDRLSAALDERAKTASQIAASTSVRGSDDLGERRKDSLVKDIRPGYGRGRAAEVELKRERREAAEARREATERDQSMTARSVQRWTERSTELRKQITDAYHRIPTA